MKKKPQSQPSQRSSIDPLPIRQWPTQRMKVDDIRPAPENPRSITTQAKLGLDASVRRFGLVEPLVFNKRSGTLVSGHQRLDVLKAANIPEVDVTVVDLSPEEEQALNLVLNNPGIQGEFTGAARDILAQLEQSLPDVYDSTLLFKIKGEVETALAEQQLTDAETGKPPEYDLAPMPYESYNYVVVLFRNEVDWTAAKDHFQVKQVTDPSSGRVGLGHVVDGAAYLKRVL